MRKVSHVVKKKLKHFSFLIVFFCQYNRLLVKLRLKNHHQLFCLIIINPINLWPLNKIIIDGVINALSKPIDDECGFFPVPIIFFDQKSPSIDRNF